VVCNGNSLKIGIITEVISPNFDTEKIAIGRVWPKYTFPIPNVLAILYKISTSSMWTSILKAKPILVQLFLGIIKKDPSASVNPTNHSKNSLEAEGKIFFRWTGKSVDILFDKFSYWPSRGRSIWKRGLEGSSGNRKFSRNFSTKLFLSCSGVQNATK